MARIEGTRGGFNLPPENRKTALSKECENSIEHTEGVAKRMVFTHYDGVKLNITKDAPGSDKIKDLIQGE